jgi:hypothetical protein
MARYIITKKMIAITSLHIFEVAKDTYYKSGVNTNSCIKIRKKLK